MSRPPGVARGLGKAIQAARIGHGWSQTDLAHKAGLSRSTVSRVELGEEPSTRTLLCLTDALDLVFDVHPRRPSN
ncbi:helix-turn-helix domain-containing protein [Microbacterium oryzae]|uniref:helix-turn-helix domain-containing protein n=1 Tax=Microbacterium oryzae TaxID=743009 RepID=UPI00339D7FB7